MDNDVTITELKEKIKKLAISKGFGITPKDSNIPEKFALIHSEVSESYEAYRKNKFEGPDCVNEEMADIIIRTLHLCIILDIDIQKEILKKLEKNQNREWKKENYNETFSNK